MEDSNLTMHGIGCSWVGFDLTDIFSKNSVYVRATFVELISLQLTSLILIILFVFYIDFAEVEEEY